MSDYTEHTEAVLEDDARSRAAGIAMDEDVAAAASVTEDQAAGRDVVYEEGSVLSRAEDVNVDAYRRNLYPRGPRR